MGKHILGRTAPTRTGLSLGIALATSAMIATAADIDPTRVSLGEVRSESAVTYHDFDVPPLALDEALVLLARQAGAELYMGSADFAGLYANPVHGRLSLEAALQQLLGDRIGYSLGGRAERPVIQLQAQPTSAVGEEGDLHPTHVYGAHSAQPRDEKGYNDVYDQDISSVYAGKEQIERYKGAAPADVFKGMLNVYSGDARNSGALDPNIRGIQGPGRVPLTIDGTEQALTVYRGYMGANNRNYIDPNLIGSIKVIKGPNLERNVYSGVGGAVVASTLSVDDILREGESYGGEFKLEASNNSVSPRVPTLRTGRSSASNWITHSSRTYLQRPSGNSRRCTTS